MRLGLPSLLVRPAAPPLKWGLVVAASLIVAETLVLYPLKRIAFENTLGVVYFARRRGGGDCLGLLAGGCDVGGQRPGLRLLPYPAGLCV